MHYLKEIAGIYEKLKCPSLRPFGSKLQFPTNGDFSIIFPEIHSLYKFIYHRFGIYKHDKKELKGMRYMLAESDFGHISNQSYMKIAVIL